MAAQVRSVRDLLVWRRAMDLVELCYRLTANFPREEKFGLTSQIRRASGSIPANIAEGFGRWNPVEFARFVSIAAGSLRELDTHLLISARLGFLNSASVDSTLRQTEELARMLYRIRKTVLANADLKARNAKPGPRAS